MSITLEERLRAYGAVLDRAMEQDMAARPHETRRPGRDRALARRVVVVGVVVAVAAVTALAVALSSGHARGSGQVQSGQTTTATGLALTPAQQQECTPTCPEEGPALTAQQKHLFAAWAQSFPKADVAKLRRLGRVFQPGGDSFVVVEMDDAIACATVRVALAQAEASPPQRRTAVVERLMEPVLRIERERTWPPRSAQPRIFEIMTQQLERGQFDKLAPSARGMYRSECGHRPTLPVSADTLVGTLSTAVK